MGTKKTRPETIEAKYEVGDFLTDQEGDLYQVTKIGKQKYSLKKWNDTTYKWKSSSRSIKRVNKTFNKTSDKRVEARIDRDFLRFLEIVSGLVCTDPWLYVLRTPTYSWQREFKSPGPVIGIEWSQGGAQGGNCWNNDDPSSFMTEGVPEPEFTEIDEVLTYFCPTITWLQYKQLLNKTMESGVHTEREYYGNHTDYGYKYIPLKTLYVYMKENGLFHQNWDIDD